MTSSSHAIRGAQGRVAGADAVVRPHSRTWRILGIAFVLLCVAVIWEAAKWLGGDPWRIHGSLLGMQIDYEHVPPLHWRIADDLSLPHTWDVVRAFVEPAQRDGPPLAAVLLGQAGFTLLEALAGFVIGALLGLGLGILFVHSRLAERALVPYVVASQTIPILAIAPIVIVAIKADLVSVIVVSAYLTFFPVTIASLRGLRAADPRAFELFQSYAASRRDVLWRLRLPTSVPFLFAAFRVAAAASIIGAIIGEQTAGVAAGLGSAIINYNQYYISGPERLWATIVMCTFVGPVLRRRRRAGRAARDARPVPTGGGLTCERARQPASWSKPGASARCSPGPDGGVTALSEIDLEIRPGRVRVAHRPVRLRQIHPASTDRRPDRADLGRGPRQRQAGRRGRARTATTGWSSRRRS